MDTHKIGVTRKRADQRRIDTGAMRDAGPRSKRFRLYPTDVPVCSVLRRRFPPDASLWPQLGYRHAQQLREAHPRNRPELRPTGSAARLLPSLQKVVPFRAPLLAPERLTGWDPRQRQACGHRWLSRLMALSPPASANRGLACSFFGES